MVVENADHGLYLPAMLYFCLGLCSSDVSKEDNDVAEDEKYNEDDDRSCLACYPLSKALNKSQFPYSILRIVFGKDRICSQDL